MTTFWRSNYWRTSINGVLHEVQGHVVDREAWATHGGNGRGYYRQLLEGIRAGRSFTATYVIPNADCPVCGAQVFFYQNRGGGRVFFEELGPPWPKHPCTNNEAYRRASTEATSATVSPHTREPDEADFAEIWLKETSLDPKADFISKHELQPWLPYSLEGRFNRRRTSFLVLRCIGDGKPKRLYLHCKSTPGSFVAGALVYYYRGWISYFDTETFLPSEFEVNRLSGATELVDALLPKDSVSRAGA